MTFQNSTLPGGNSLKQEQSTESKTLQSISEVENSHGQNLLQVLGLGSEEYETSSYSNDSFFQNEIFEIASIDPIPLQQEDCITIADSSSINQLYPPNDAEKTIPDNTLTHISFEALNYKQDASASLSQSSDNITPSLKLTHVCVNSEEFGEVDSVVDEGNVSDEKERHKKAEQSKRVMKKEGGSRHSAILTEPATQNNGASKQKHKTICKFLLDSLYDKRCNPAYIMWTDEEQGQFKIVNGSELAKMWSHSRNKPPISYAHFARNLRNWYKKNYLKRAPGKKLMYQFTESWYTSYE